MSKELTKLEKAKLAFNLILFFGIVGMMCWWKWK
ncbi:hypothetical protein CKC_04035 [Candidatus Liberibacter solanacearum CLso-ZC1]|uniref:Transmembrane protein n=1 Tax=Liberibacter solanacearum (strain CLso-ZC1) TaxID=658172 RepID=E4UB77_LIBSC|nr:hypothetical protein CKC_04035 [Candidatus Liberibacter solanacearum CLso-ZC1]